MPPARRLTAAVVAGLTSLLGLTGCSAADRAVLGAPPCRDAPEAVPGWTDVVSLASNGHTTDAGRADDHVSAVPARVAGLPPARWIGAAGLTGYAVDVDGALWAWGSGTAIGRYAAGSAVLTPVRIPLPGPVLAVSGSHALVAPSGVAL